MNHGDESASTTVESRWSKPSQMADSQIPAITTTTANVVSKVKNAIAQAFRVPVFAPSLA